MKAQGEPMKEEPWELRLIVQQNIVSALYLEKEESEGISNTTALAAILAVAFAIPASVEKEKADSSRQYQRPKTVPIRCRIAVF